jgi:hypothetical protein
MELNRGYHNVVVEARQAMRRTIAEMVPADSQTARQLLTIALVGQFADFIANAMGGAISWRSSTTARQRRA